jgi:hypothetical protein
MPPNSNNWPMWLFIVTVLLVGGYAAHSFNYKVQTSKLTEQREAFNKTLVEYDKRVADVKRLFTGHQTVFETIMLPVVNQNCSNMLGQRLCSPATHMEERSISKITQISDQTVKLQLDQALTKINKDSARAAASTEKINSLDQANAFVRNLMAPLISVAILCASLFVILSGGYKAEGEKWAFGSLGTIVGFWLK